MCRAVIFGGHIQPRKSVEADDATGKDDGGQQKGCQYSEIQVFALL